MLNVADTAAMLYREATLEDRRSAFKIWDTVTKTQDRLIKTIRSQIFKKYIFVAHKYNGKNFSHKVCPLYLFSYA